MTIKLHHELQNISTMHMQTMILSYESSTIFHIISTLLTLVGLLWTLTNHQVHQMFSRPLKKYSYDVKRDIFLQFNSSIICSIQHVGLSTQNVSLLTSSSQSKLVFKFNHCLFCIITFSCLNLFKPISISSYHYTLSSTINPRTYGTKTLVLHAYVYLPHP